MLAARSGKWEYIERLVDSPVLHHSEALCHLLKFLARHALEQPGVSLKEYQIATEVFGRPKDFDPRLDSTVRVQVARLRAKLAEYYATLGSDDPVIVDVPKGTYTAVFHERPARVLAAPPPAPATPEPPSYRLRGRWLAVSGLLAATLLALAGAVWLRGSGSPLDVFWGAFLGKSGDPLVIFSNAEFVGRPETGLRYFDAARDSGAQILDHYTGVGEALSVDALARAFRALGRDFTLRRGRLISWDDTRDRNLVFIGSPSENLSLRDLPIQQEFVFQPLDAPPRQGDLAIINQKPQPGEQSAYLATRGLPIAEDYAVVSVFPGLNPPQSILLLAGTTTFGTQGAAEFVCRPDRVRELLSRLGSVSRGIPPFAMILRVKINGGVPVQSEIVALRLLRRKS